MKRADFKPLILEALAYYEGTASPAQVTKYIWDSYRARIEDHPVIYSWQYDVRWAAQSLKHDGLIRLSKPRRGYWSLVVEY